MKVTSYEISKKLWNTGFRASSKFQWHNSDYCASNGENIEYPPLEPVGDIGIYGAYDLETILEALPDQVENDCRILHFQLTRESILYNSETWNNLGLEVDREENESLADTAARLLINLVEEGIINLKE